MSTPVRIRAPQSASLFKVRAHGRAVSLTDDLYYLLLTRPWWQYGALLAGTWLSVNAVFAVLYALQPGCVSGARNWLDLYFFSVQTMATIGYGAMAPTTTFAHVLVTMQALVGIMGVAVVTGVTFAKFAKPSARVLFSKYAVIQPRDGVPHLCFRMVNWRHNQIVEAQMRVMLLMLETTREGQTLRTPIEIPLVRDRSALFFLAWQVMHRLDENSPLVKAGGVEKLKDMDAQLVLSLTGTDETLAQTVHARHMYQWDEIVPNARFADVLHSEPDGTRVMNYHNVHKTVPIDYVSTPS